MTTSPTSPVSAAGSAPWIFPSPCSPKELGYNVPHPEKGNSKSNDVFCGDNGLLNLMDRYDGLEILKTRP